MEVPISRHSVVSAPCQALLGCACPPHRHAHNSALWVLPFHQFTVQITAFSNLYMGYYATFHILSPHHSRHNTTFRIYQVAKGTLSSCF